MARFVNILFCLKLPFDRIKYLSNNQRYAWDMRFIRHSRSEADKSRLINLISHGWLLDKLYIIRFWVNGNAMYFMKHLLKKITKRFLLVLGPLRDKGPVKLIKRVKIAHSFSQSVSNQFHFIILSLPM